MRQNQYQVRDKHKVLGKECDSNEDGSSSFLKESLGRVEIIEGMQYPLHLMFGADITALIFRVLKYCYVDLFTY